MDSHGASPLALLALQSFLSHHQFYRNVLSHAVPEVDRLWRQRMLATASKQGDVLVRGQPVTTPPLSPSVL